MVITGCGRVSSASNEPYRCLHETSLKQLIEAENIPQSPGIAASSYEEGLENTIFDGEQDAVISVGDTTALVRRLCPRLKSQLAQRCDVKDFWSGDGYCAAEVASPTKAVTSAGGVYTARPVHGRVFLSATPVPPAQSKLVLVLTEWKN
jgi:hypothetical protein